MDNIAARGVFLAVLVGVGFLALARQSRPSTAGTSTRVERHFAAAALVAFAAAAASSLAPAVRAVRPSDRIPLWANAALGVGWVLAKDTNEIMKFFASKL